MKTTMAMASALLATTLAGAPAAAVVKVATYTGTVSSGYDYTGEFSAANTDLTGKTFVARYVYDTAAPGAYHNTSAGSYDEIYGGAAYGGSDPVLSATVTIGNVTRTIDTPQYYGFAYVYGGIIAEEEAVDYAYDPNGFHQNYAYSYVEYDTSIPTSLATSFTSTGAAYGEQYVYLYSDDYSTGLQHYAYAEANATTLTVGGAVPEPATWALFVGGFAAVGTAARRRRVVAA